MNHDTAKLCGTLKLVLTDSTGLIKYSTEVPNTIVNTGRAFIAQSLIKTTVNSPASMSHMALGTNSTTVAVSQTALITEIGVRAAVTPANTTVTVTNDTIQYIATFGAGVSTGAITEAGIFNASTAGTMLCRTVFAVINKGVDDTLTITWRVTAT